MKVAHNVVLNVFVKPEDNEESVREKLLSLIPFDIEEEKITLQKEVAEGFDDKKIIIYKILLEKNKHTKKFIFDLIEKFSEEQIELLKKQIDSRLDDHLHFFIRLDKDALLKDKIEITDSGNCFHIKMSIATYPASKEKARNLIWNLLNKDPLE
jgi:RNA binding exosome subunit